MWTELETDPYYFIHVIDVPGHSFKFSGGGIFIPQLGTG